MSIGERPELPAPPNPTAAPRFPWGWIAVCACCYAVLKWPTLAEPGSGTAKMLGGLIALLLIPFGIGGLAWSFARRPEIGLS